MGRTREGKIVEMSAPDQHAAVSIPGKRSLSPGEDTGGEDVADNNKKKKRRKVGNPLLMFVQDELCRNRGEEFGLKDLEREYWATLATINSKGSLQIQNVMITELKTKDILTRKITKENTQRKQP